LRTPLPSSIRATCPAHLILLDFITRTIMCEEYNKFRPFLYLLLFIVDKILNHFMLTV
jgi:hypothetical protein